MQYDIFLHEETHKTVVYVKADLSYLAGIWLTGQGLHQACAHSALPGTCWWIA